MPPKRRNTSSPEPSPSPPPKRLRPTYLPPSETTILSYDDPEAATPSAAPKAPSPNPKFSSSSHSLTDPPFSYDDDDDNGSYSSAESEPVSEQPRLNPIYGQRSAFPGLEGHDPDELFYGPASDGIEYLRMVRSEANTLPSLFVAPEESTSASVLPEEAIPSSQSKTVGADANRAFTAPSTHLTTSHPARPLAKEPGTSQKTYYAALHLRYNLLRATLKCTPPAESIASLTPSNPITFPPNSKEAYRQWKYTVKNVEPTMVQLACMDHDSVLRVIDLVSQVLEDGVREAVAAGSRKKCKILGAWCWGLLGRIREVGELGSEEVGEVRDMGKAAVEGLNILKKCWEGAAGGEGKERDMVEEESVGSEEEWEGIVDNQDEDAKEEEDEEDALLGQLDGTSEVVGEGQQDIDPDEVAVTNGDSNGEVINGHETFQGPPKQADNPGTFSIPSNLDSDLEAAKARLQSRLSAQTPLYTTNAKPNELQSDIPPTQQAEEDEELNYDPETVPGTESAELEKSSEIGEEDVLKQVSAMLDMAITIVGEAYGQRDLLEEREVWVEPSS